MPKTEFDAVVVGSGPNGLSAAITLQRAGLSVKVLEAKDTIGGGTRSAELTLPGFIHDICSAIHPMGVGSPFFRQLPLHKFGLEFINPTIPAAHPFDDGTAASLRKSVEETAQLLGADADAYRSLFEPIVKNWPGLAPDVLGPLHFPKHPIDLASFGLSAVLPATQLVKRFNTRNARGLLAGMAAHAIQPLSNVATSAIALVLMTAGHCYNWPIPKGGSQNIADALAGYFQSLGGQIEVGRPVRKWADIPTARAIIFDVTPWQLLQIAEDKLSSLYNNRLKRYRYGMGVFKIDWALSEPIPFTAPECRQAGTVHIGGTFEEIAEGEQLASDGKLVEKPYVLLAQQSLFDTSRAPKGKHTGWAYCHVPNGSTIDQTNIIEQQVERFAPGFRDCILARHTLNTAQMEAYNPNYIGGDINGGIIDVGQLFTRPVVTLPPYNTSTPGLYIGSSSTPPGGGVHGMCGYYAAHAALRDTFGLKSPIDIYAH